MLIFTSFHFAGRRPVSYDVLNIIDNTGAMGSSDSFSIFALTKSGDLTKPGDLLMFKPLSFLSMVSAS